MTSPHIFPLRLTGDSIRRRRWQWLVKWLLAIPHFVVLVFLWIGFCGLDRVVASSRSSSRAATRAGSSTTTSALRWSWRVAYSIYGASAPTVPALAGRRSRLSRRTRGSNTPSSLSQRPRSDQVVAARDPAVHHRRHLHRRSVVNVGR